jgi:prepilin-type N-terminal cleavage/methylation domain-containing protein
MKTPKPDRGFSLIEVLIGLFLMAVAVLGLAELFLAAVANNLKAERVANATFLAQQEIDWLRGLTRDELDVYSTSSSGIRDETIDLNGDGTNDFRRITVVPPAAGNLFDVTVHVYSAERIAGYTASDLLADPVRNRPRAEISTLISR